MMQANLVPAVRGQLLHTCLHGPACCIRIAMGLKRTVSGHRAQEDVFQQFICMAEEASDDMTIHHDQRTVL